MKRFALIVLVLISALTLFASGFSAATSVGVNISSDFFKSGTSVVPVFHSELSRDVQIGWTFGKWTPHINAKYGITSFSFDNGFTTIRPFTYAFAGAGVRYDFDDKLAFDCALSLGFGTYMSNMHNFNMLDVTVRPELDVLGFGNGGDFVLLMPVGYRRAPYYDSLSLGIAAGVRK